MQLVLILYESLVSDSLALLCVLNFVSPLEEGLIILVHCTHMVLVERIDARMDIFDPISPMVIKVAIWENVLGTRSKLTVESCKVLCRFPMLLHQQGQFFDISLDLK